MSRRYGRNQRRQARAREAALDRDKKAAESMAAEYRRIAHKSEGRTRRMLAEIREMIGPDHPLLVPSRQKKFDGDRFYTFPPMDFGEALLSPPTEFETIENVLMLIAHLHEPKRDEWRRQMHFRVSFDEQDWGYALSLDAIQTLPLPIIATRIADEFARMIVAYMKDTYR